MNGVYPQIHSAALPARECPLCEALLGEALLTIAQPDRFEKSVGIPAQGFWRVWRTCPGCGAAINQHKSANSEKVALIAQNYYEVDLGDGIEAKYRLVMGLPEEKSDNASRARRVLEKVLAIRALQQLARPDILRVADVGAGTGVFLAKLRQVCGERGIQLDAVAIEPDPIAAAHIRTLGIAQVCEDVLDERFSQTGFDLVTFNKVVEHIEIPGPVIEHGRRILSDSVGLLYIEVPDVLTIHQRDSSDNILGSLHHHLYALPTLDCLLRRSGLVPVELQRVVEPSGKLTVFGFSLPDRRYQLLALQPEKT